VKASWPGPTFPRCIMAGSFAKNNRRLRVAWWDSYQYSKRLLTRTGGGERTYKGEVIGYGRRGWCLKLPIGCVVFTPLPANGKPWCRKAASLTVEHL
jgi:hypothetical protein